MRVVALSILPEEFREVPQGLKPEVIVALNAALKRRSSTELACGSGALLQIKDKCKVKAADRSVRSTRAVVAPKRKADSSRRFPFLRKAKLGRNDKGCGVAAGTIGQRRAGFRVRAEDGVDAGW